MDRETAERVWRRVRGEALPPGDRVEHPRGEDIAAQGCSLTMPAQFPDGQAEEQIPSAEPLRVCHRQRPDGRAEEERARLRREMDAAENTAEVYAQLGKRCCPLADEMERQRRQELRRLRGEYYLCTGELPPRAERCALGRETISLLRQAALEEEAAAEHFARMAEGCRAGQKEMYAAFRSQAEERARQLRELLLRYLDAARSQRR